MINSTHAVQALKGFKAIEAIEEFLYYFGTYLTENMNAEEAFLTAAYRIEGPISTPLQKCVTLLLKKALPLNMVFEVLASSFNSNDILRYFRFLTKVLDKDPQIAGPIVLESLSTLKSNRTVYEKRQRIYQTLFLKMYMITFVLGLVMGFVNGLAPLFGFLGSPILLDYEGLSNTDFSPIPYWPTLYGGFFLVTFLSYKNMKLFKVKYQRIHSLIIGGFYLLVSTIVSTLFAFLF
ncbi:MAG: hypothetical protein ACW976_01410 [Candidatus Ranarchaeia archaeon]|jgi:hypothetical protein